MNRPGLPGGLLEDEDATAELEAAAEFGDAGGDL